MGSRRRQLQAGLLGASLVVSMVIAPAASGSARLKPAGRWRLAKVFGGVAVTDVTSAGRGVAWAVGYRPSWAVFVQQWTGGNWRPVHTPRAMIADAGPQIAASSATNAWVFTFIRPAVSDPYSVAWHWNGHGWQRFRLGRNTTVAAAEVFSPGDAWAFGDQGSTPYVLRYDGSRWRRVAAPLRPVAVTALSADNLWVVGSAGGGPAGRQSALTIARWSSGSWHVRTVPAALLPKGMSVVDAGLHAVSASDIYVGIGLVSANGRRAVVVLRWRAGSWRRLGLPRQPIGVPAVAMAADGRGGLWLAVDTERRYGAVVYDYRSGRWSAPMELAGRGQVTAIWTLARQPGTRSAWAAGSLWRTAGEPPPTAVLYSHGG
jgi:hypothetical protein